VSNRLYEVHRRTRGNIGDFFCNPSRYFDFRPITKKLTDELNVNNSTLIIGGGGLIHPSFTPKITELVEQKPKNIIVWSIGSNYAIDKDKGYPAWLKEATLVGIRDFNISIINSPIGEYVPCVTCMHPAFNREYTIKHNKVYYLHARQTSSDAVKLLEGKPQLTNKAKEFDRVIQFLGSGETIVTDSYHGAYWGMLLGRNVQVVPWSTKFKTFKHMPVLLENILEESNDTMYIDPKYKDDCQKINKRFYDKFKDLCGL
jgi:hypothetical protein